MAKVEFASPEWLAALKSMLDRYAAAAGPGVTLSICEVFTGVPSHLDAKGDGRIAWHCRIENGRLTTFAEGEIDAADIKTVADYDFILPFARMKLEPGGNDEYQRQQAEGARLGKVAHSGDRSKVPPAFYGMHNELAEMTA
ncbi:MAG: hypothetical protein GC203_15520 [Phenylobacterium sp.]|uniref:hypothetical protein n=1 Tax=Phenylobacterium sp. TaxID=1871053 RepID=UPI0025D182A3|nr:hypothetical protein [Phenylobacterium sp.]MBI1199269.1 hypothetical protein [Phenylobacterium sp.]